MSDIGFVFSELAAGNRTRQHASAPYIAALWAFRQHIEHENGGVTMDEFRALIDLLFAFHGIEDTADHRKSIAEEMA